MARWNDRKGKQEKQQVRRKPASDSDDVRYGAFHEAGHAVVSHALGRRVVYIRITPVRLPAGHPDNPTGSAMISAGFTRSEPLMAGEINAQRRARQPFTDEQLDWLLQEAVIDLAGGITEAVVSRSSEIQGATADLAQFGHIAGWLGQVEERNGDTIVTPVFQRVAQDVARTILADLAEETHTLARVLIANPVLNGEALSAVLSRLPRGSHTHLLDSLRARCGPAAGQCGPESTGLQGS